MRNLLAFDIGASNGRAILGQFDGERISMRELHRFENHYVEMNGIYYWDLPYIYNQLKQGFLAFRRADIGALDCFGIDTWGVDYGLLDKNGHLLSNPRAYRNAVEEDCTEAWKAMDFPALFAHTGIGNESFNTAYQLYRRKREDDAALEAAETLLFMPDLLGYFLTGEKKSEYTETTTSMLYNPIKRDWDRDIMAAFGLPERIFPPIDMPGTMRGRLRSDIARELGINCAAFAAVGTHDTASAVAAIPGSGSFAFCSSGTWSVFGIETDIPLLTDEVRDAGFSNEGTVQGGFRPLKNIMGLWLIQECRREWQAEGISLSWDEIVREAEAAEPFRSIIDPLLFRRSYAAEDTSVLRRDKPAPAGHGRQLCPLRIRIPRPEIPLYAGAARRDKGTCHRKPEHCRRREQEPPFEPIRCGRGGMPRDNRPHRGRRHRQPAGAGYGAGRYKQHRRASGHSPPLRGCGVL